VVSSKLTMQCRRTLLPLTVHAIYTIKHHWKPSLLCNFKEPSNVICIWFSKIYIYHGPSELVHTL
jgi:hypothetical protein